MSYTQFEALYAAKLGKPVWRILATEDLESRASDGSCDEPEELRELQLAYRRRLEGSTDLYTIATSDDSLKLAVTNLRSEVARLRRRARLWATAITAIGLATLATSVWLVRGQMGTQQAAEDAQVASKAAEIAAVGAEEEAAAGRVAAETGGRRVERLASQVEIEAARATVEAAFAAGDRSMRGQVQAMERLLVSGFAYTGAMMDGLSLSRGVMPGADFSRASIRDGDLSGSMLDGGSLDQADLVYVDLGDASLRDVRAEATHFEFSQGVDADFSRAKLRRSSFFSSDLRGANFRRADLSFACLAYCDLTGADFSGADLSNTTFFGSILDDVRFDGATMVNVDVTGAVVVDQPDLTATQVEGLRRTHGLYADRLQIRIWGDLDESGQRTQSMSEAFNSYYTDFKSIRTGTSPTISFRDRSEVASEGEACVGGFSAYMEGYADVRYLERFQATFWGKPGRAKRIKGWLNRHGILLAERLADGPWIEGTNAQREAWTQHLAGAVPEMRNPDGPLMLNEDGMLVLLLAAGAADANSINWNDAAKKRLKIDAETSTMADSFAPLFHPTAWNVHLPEYDATYRDWTLQRAETIGLPQSIAIDYNLEQYKVVSLKRSEHGGEGPVLLFGVEGEGGVPLSGHRESKDARLLRASRWFAGDAPMMLPEPRRAYSVTPGPTPRDDDGWVRMRLRLVVTGVELDKRGSPVLLVEPETLSHISEDDRVLWEAPIKLDH